MAALLCAVVVGSALTSLVNALVKDILTPISKPRRRPRRFPACCLAARGKAVTHCRAAVCHSWSLPAMAVLLPACRPAPQTSPSPHPTPPFRSRRRVWGTRLQQPYL
jgi:hypothetical protein